MKPPRRVWKTPFWGASSGPTRRPRETRRADGICPENRTPEWTLACRDDRADERAHGCAEDRDRQRVVARARDRGDRGCAQQRSAERAQERATAIVREMHCQRDRDLRHDRRSVERAAKAGIVTRAREDLVLDRAAQIRARDE